jgi:mono/diheme cytochrome c family protein
MRMEAAMGDRSPQKVCAVVGLFESADALLKAAAEARLRNESAALGRLEAYTPYPVHGLERALALKPSPLGYMVLGGGLCGAAAAFLAQAWMNAVDYRVIVGGKPFFSWPAWVPVMFELMVLLGAFTAFFGMFGALNRLPYTGNPLLGSRSMRAITRDRFALALHALNPEALFDAEKAELFLRSLGTAAVEHVPVPAVRPRDPNRVPLKEFGIIAAAAAAAVFGGWCMYWLVKLWPEIRPNIYLATQNKLLPQAAEPFFTDQKGMRTPPYGAIARGGMPYPFQSNLDDEKAGQVLGNPLALTAEALSAGRIGYQRFCMVCHGSSGDGQKLLSAQYGASPANLQSARIRQYPDGRIFHVIRAGKGLMPGYQAQLTEDETWEIVHYLRALQRSQNASEADLQEALKGYIVVEPKESGGGQSQ